MIRVYLFSLLLVTAANFPASAATPSEIQIAIAERIRDGIEPVTPAVGDALSQSDILARIYMRSAYAPLWTRAPQVMRFLNSIADAHEDGLLVEDYHFSLLNKMVSAREPIAAAELDILLTDAFARLSYHLRFGKANPQNIDANWNFSRALITDDPAQWLRRAIDQDEISEALEWLRPKMPVFHALKAALRRYRDISAAGGWRQIPLGPTLKPGMDDPRVVTLRARLKDFGDAPTSADSSSHFDSDLERLVRNFQRNYGLVEDGLVGAITQSTLNRTAEAHVAQLRINLERIRWIFRDVEENFLAVNIAAFHAAYIERGDIVWSGRAVVGRPFRQTPSFKATMTHMIFNPTWTVPPTILKDDVLPAMRKDPTYLRRKNLHLLSHTGTQVDPLAIDWQRASGGNFPYLLRQDPGPQNALGRVKFIFPNSHLVYLHDTPSRDLFDRAERTFSSGCIRIERPLELAEILLRTNNDQTRPSVEQILATNSPYKVNLEHPVTVMLLYLTAFTSADGALQFRRDIYDRDPAVLQALDGPFKFFPPKGYSNNRIDKQFPAKIDANP